MSVHKQTNKEKIQGFSCIIFIGQRKVCGTNWSRQVALWPRPVPDKVLLGLMSS